MKYLVIVPVVFALLAAPAEAQSTDTRSVSVGVGGGMATPLHGDFDFTAGAWQVDFRFGTGRYLASTMFIEQWLRNEDEVRIGVPILGPTGPMGRIDRITTATSHRTSAVGWSLLARSTGRVVVSGGGGVSYLLYARKFTQTAEGCTPASLCTTSRSEFDNSAFAAQLQAGIDAEVVRHLAVMAQFRVLVPIDDPGSGHHTLVGGMRLRF